MQEMSHRDLRLDNLRAKLITIVVIGHFLLPLYRTRFVTGLIYAIYIFHMPCFLMLSGYFAKSLYRREGQQTGSDADVAVAGSNHQKITFRWNRVIEIFWLYLVYELIVWITEGLAYGQRPPYPDLLHESGAPWYLMTLGTCYLLTPLLEMLRSKVLHTFWRRAAFVCILSLGISFLKYVFQVGDLLSLDRTVSFLPFYAAGYLTTEEDLADFMQSRRRLPVSAAAILLLAVTFFCMYDYFMPWHLVVYGADYGRYLPEMQPTLWALNLLWYGIAVLISLGVAGLMPDREIPSSEIPAREIPSSEIPARKTPGETSREMLPAHTGQPAFSLTAIGRRTLGIFILHRPIRDLLEWRGFYRIVSAHSKLQVLGVIALSVLLTLILGLPVFDRAFNRLRRLPAQLLEKCRRS